MAWIATDKDGTVGVYTDKPKRFSSEWLSENCDCDVIDDHAALILTGLDLTWNDEPVEIKIV